MIGMRYAIVEGKVRLGTIIHKESAAVVTIQDIKSKDQRELAPFSRQRGERQFVRPYQRPLF